MCRHFENEATCAEELQQKVKIMEDALTENVKLLNSSDSAKKNLEAKVARYEQQITKLDVSLVS